MVTEPPGVVTTTVAGPAVPDGVVQDTEVVPFVSIVQVLPPTVTEALVRLDPAMVTTVPPRVGPTLGAIAVTPGASV
jgi:hypothetical protein